MKMFNDMNVAPSGYAVNISVEEDGWFVSRHVEFGSDKKAAMSYRDEKEGQLLARFSMFGHHYHWISDEGKII